MIYVILPAGYWYDDMPKEKPVWSRLIKIKDYQAQGYLRGRTGKFVSFPGDYKVVLGPKPYSSNWDIVFRPDQILKPLGQIFKYIFENEVHFKNEQY